MGWSNQSYHPIALIRLLLNNQQHSEVKSSVYLRNNISRANIVERGTSHEIRLKVHGPRASIRNGAEKLRIDLSATREFWGVRIREAHTCQGSVAKWNKRHRSPTNDAQRLIMISEDRWSNRWQCDVENGGDFRVPGQLLRDSPRGNGFSERYGHVCRGMDGC